MSGAASHKIPASGLNSCEIMLAVLRNLVQDDYPLGGNTKINSPTCTCSLLVFVNPIQGTFKINPLHF